MSTNVTGFKTFPASAAICAFRRVSLNSSGQLAYATASVKGIGVTRDDASGAGGLVTVQLFNQGTAEIRISATASFTTGGIAYGASDGRIQGVAATGAAAIGIVTESVASATDVIEIIPA